MTNRVNTKEIDERLVVASVRKDRTAIREINPPPLEPLKAEVSPQPEAVALPITEPLPKVEAEKEEIPVTVSTSEPQKDESRNKRGSQQEYEVLFVKENDLPPARFGKSVYVRKEYHDRISQIVSVIGGNEVSLFAYIDNVLAHHFENFKDDIARSFKKKIIFK